MQPFHALRSQARNQHFILLAVVLAVSAFSSGCETTSNGHCGSLVSAIEHLGANHLTPTRAEFDSKQFEKAQAQLLKNYNVALPKGYVKDPTSQCTNVVKQIHAQHKSKRVSDILVDLLDLYVRSWDPHSSAMSEADFASESTLYRGYGFATERTIAPQRFEIVEVIAGSPAHDAGLMKGTLIISVNGQHVREKTSSEFAALVNSGDSVKLGVSSHEVPFRELVLKRGRFEVAPVKFRTYQNGALGYLRLRTFAGAEPVFAEALQTLSTSRALILDLRDLRGGSVQSASNIADWLTTGTEVFGGMLNHRRQITTLKFQRTTSIWDGPIVVLVNGNTMSAAELLAGSLQDYGAVVVGQRTFGKGTRQSFKPLTGFGIDGGVYLTDAYIVRPSGGIVQRNGVSPDVTLPSISGATSRETALPGALPTLSALAPLIGQDVSTLPSHSKSVRRGLSELEGQLRVMIETGELGRTEEDQQIEAAKRIALFLAAQAEGAADSGAPAQIELPFIDE